MKDRAVFSRYQRQVLAEIDAKYAIHRSLPASRLARVVERIRQQILQPGNTPISFASEVIAICQLAIEHAFGWNLYDVQAVAAHALISGNIAEMQTGEGKTLSGLPAAVFGAVLGQGVHIATPTVYLAERDHQQLSPVFEMLGLSAGLLSESEPSTRPYAYACDVTFGPGYEFGFDYLRDQMTLKKEEETMLGAQTLRRIRNSADSVAKINQRRGLAYCIVDEADHVLVDDASSPLVLSEFQPGTAPDAEAVQLANQLAQALEIDTDFTDSNHQIELTEQGRRRIYESKIKIPMKQLTRPWNTYVETAIKAIHHFQKDVHYVLSSEQIKIVDAMTGRIFDDRSWQAGLHQAVEAKEGVPITPEKLPLAQITRQRFYRMYNHVSGMTGTALGCQSEIKSIYGLGVTPIPLRIPSQRVQMPMRVFGSESAKWDAITKSVVDTNRRGQPILIGTRTIRESELIASQLESCGLPFQLLNGKQDADEAHIVSLAGQRGGITIATNMAGRGTDIRLGDRVSELGGLHVIVSECHESTRIDRQLIGRCARQGNPGSAQTFVSADDWLLQTHGPWLANSIRKLASDKELEVDISARIQKLQQLAERVNYAMRLEVMKAAEKREKLTYQPAS